MKTLLSPKLFMLAAAALVPILLNSCAEYYDEAYYDDGYYDRGYSGYYAGGYQVPLASSVYYASHHDHYNYRRCSSCSYSPCRCHRSGKYHKGSHGRPPSHVAARTGRGRTHLGSNTPRGSSAHRAPHSGRSSSGHGENARGPASSGPRVSPRQSGGSSRPRTQAPKPSSGNRHFDLAGSGSRSGGNRSAVPVSHNPGRTAASSSGPRGRATPSSSGQTSSPPASTPRTSPPRAAPPSRSARPSSSPSRPSRPSRGSSKRPA